MTSDRPTFFVPHIDLEKHEDVYQELARACGRRAAPLGERIYSITYRHDSEMWTATVGQQLKGNATRTRRVRGKRVEQTQHLSNASTVTAIYADEPFLVWHDGASRAWVNPFMAGRPYSVVHFAASAA